VTTLSPRFDRAAIETQILAIARDLLHELGDTSGAGAVCSSSIIDRDLGLGSIERVELLSRIERTFGISLPENAVSDAVTLGDIVSGIARAAAGEGASIEQNFDSYPRAEGNSNARDFIFGVPASQTPRNADTFRRDGEPRGFRRIFEMLYGVFAATVFLLWLVFTWLIVLAMPPGSRAARITSKALQLYFRVIGCRITVDGREHLDAYGSCIYVSNHTSYSDVLVVMAVVHTDYRFVAKSEINDMPFIGTFLRKLGHFAFERGKLRARSRQAEQMGKALLRGESLFVFAEGTFTAEPGVRPFQLGAFRAAVKTGRPIVPVALRGTRYLLQDGTFLPKPSRITVTVSPALFANLTPEGGEWTEVLRLRDETRRIISSHSGEPLLSRPEGPPQPPDNPSSA
jgi:1-acyl-sn-glycerol-3-phosphate acyltransferase